MFYQRIMTAASPYAAWIREACADFPEHRHADIELHYCTKGSFRILLDQKETTVYRGELVLVPPMVSHSLPVQSESIGSVLTVVLGFSFLRESFSVFSGPRVRPLILTRDAVKSVPEELFSLLEETARTCHSCERIDELLLRGNLCRIFYHLATAIAPFAEETERAQRGAMKNIDSALDLIHHEYRSPLSVEQAAAVTGYSKSNFCKLFKEITGDTFHNALNRYRTEIAAELLTESDLSVAEISDTVGFSEQKTFCRVFRELRGLTPGSYRRLTVKNGT